MVTGMRQLGISPFKAITGPKTGRFIRRALAAAVLVVLAVAFVVYPDLVRASDEAPPAPEGPFAENLTFSDPPVPAPSTAFETLDGVALSLAEFKGEVVLVNFWATWCAPCVREMPALERLHLTLKDEGFLVMAVSEDRGGAAKVAPFLDRLGLKDLPIFLDKSGERRGKLAQAFGLRGLPATYLIGRDGTVIAGMTGPAEWDSPEAVDFIRHYLKPSATQPAALPKDESKT